MWTDQSRSRSHDSIVVVGLVVAYHNDSFDTDIEAVRRDVVLVRLVANSVFALNLLGYAGIERLKTSNPAGQEQENHRGHALHRYSLSPMASLSPIVAFDDVAVDVGLHRVTGAHSGLLVNMSAHWWDEMLDGFVVANEWGSEGLLANNFGIRPDGNMVLHNQHYAQTPVDETAVAQKIAIHSEKVSRPPHPSRKDILETLSHIY